jgi:hypothetical protein
VGTDGRTDRPTDQPTNAVSYKGASSRLKIIEIDEKRLRKKVPLIKTDYEEGRLQPTPAGHPKGELLSTGFVNFS